MEFKKTKIVCTIGPATNNEPAIRKLIEAGMNVARLNFSHGTLEEHKKTINLIRNISKKINANISILQDLPGPKIRLGKLDKASYELKKNDIVTLTKANIVGDNRKFSCSHREIIDALVLDDLLFINDGRIKLIVVDKNENELALKVLNSGEIRSYKGINAPSKNINIKAVTAKDIEFIKFGMKMNVDFIAASFVRTKDDILKIKKLLSESKKNIRVIAKIERQEAIENIDGILTESDGIMIARGDLGIEIPLEKIDLNQKFLAGRARIFSKPSIVATQMLLSMTENPYPTRAEVSDVTNAIFDGADALMLSEETAIGNFPAIACRTMNDICLTVEKSIQDPGKFRFLETGNDSMEFHISNAVKNLCNDLKIEAIIVITNSGRTAQFLSSRKIIAPIFAFTSNPETIKFLNLTWSAMPVYIPKISKNINMTGKILEIIKIKKLVKSSALIIIINGTANNVGIRANLIEIQQTI